MTIDALVFGATALGFGGMFFAMGFFTGASYIVRVRETAARRVSQRQSKERDDG